MAIQEKAIENRSFGAFIMTYERPHELLKTINKLLAQTLSPQKIVVVDNSSNEETKKTVDLLNDPRVEYYRVGFNSGPAGAASIGLSLLTSYGFEWIYWGDDDDPPASVDSFENVFKIVGVKSSDKIGIIGGLGGQLNKRTGRTLNFQNRELKGIEEADYIPGNKLMIVHSNVVKDNILPTEKLFFGFEELDFCLKVKKSGYKIFFDGAPILAHRIASGNIDSTYRWKGKSIGNTKILWRQYYSTRNMLFILKTNGLWPALIYNFLRTLVKSIYGFRFGFNYGVKYLRIQWLAIFHFAVGRFGKTDL